MIYLDDLAAFLREALPPRAGQGAASGRADDMHGLYEPAASWAAQRARPVRRVGLALEPWPALFEWAEGEALDALFLHRPWGAEDLAEKRPPHLAGLLAAHEVFDRHLGIGPSRRLARALGLSGLEACGWKHAHPLGWVGTPGPVGGPLFRSVVQRAMQVFGGLEVAHPPARSLRRTVGRVAVVGALREELVEEAHAAGAAVYVTGQWRPSAAAAVGRAGLGVVATGHRRSERWGLRALAGAFAQRFAHLEVALAPRP